jgi:16S rRNA (guanine966-N2)-methyltransferase
VREALFSAVESWCGSLDGLRFLDLYAGSGAVGLEAWSRGAGAVTLVEQDRRTAALIRENAKGLGFTGVEVVARSASTFLDQPPSAPYDVVFLDPPYDLPDHRVAAVLDALSAGGFLASRALVVVERSGRGAGPAWPDGLTPAKARRYGETALWYGRATV